MIVPDPTCREFADTPFLAACPAIREHRDHDLAYEDGAVGIHVPVVTSAEVDFRLKGSRVTMAAGEAWYLRPSDPHSVRNGGTRARVHLVIDARVHAWIAGLLARARA